MTIEEIARRSAELRPGAGDWPLPAIALAGELEAELADPTTLTQVADRLVQLAISAECSAVAGASPLGDRLAGAVVAQSEGALRLSAGDMNGSRVMFLDGLVNTGVQIARALRTARRSGMENVVGGAVLGRRDALEVWRAEGDQIVVLQEV